MLKTITILDTPERGMPLKSLKDFNAEKQARWADINAPKPNGIACPQCGQECAETGNPNQHMSGEPPKWKIACPSCSWRGSRVAC